MSAPNSQPTTPQGLPQDASAPAPGPVASPALPPVQDIDAVDDLDHPLPPLPSASSSVASATMTSLPIMTGNHPVRTSDSEQVRKLKLSAELLSNQLADLALTIASAPEGNRNIANLRTRLNNKTADLKMVLSNLRTLSQLNDNSLDCTAYKKYSSIVPEDLQPFQWEGNLHSFGYSLISMNASKISRTLCVVQDWTWTPITFVCFLL